jgi:hypothetical protein
MRQRGPGTPRTHSSSAAGNANNNQHHHSGVSRPKRRLVGAEESSSSWEITSEKSSIEPLVAPNAPRSHPESLQLGPSHAHHLQYQTTRAFLSADALRRYEPSLFEMPRLDESFHVKYRTALHVPDKQYRDFLLGVKQKQRRRHPPLVTKPCVLSACAGFSVVATLFLIFVGIVIDTQPLYIKGSLAQQITQTSSNGKFTVQYLVPTTDSARLPAAKSAYRAAVAYAVTFMICLVTLYPDRFRWLHRRRRKQQYSDIPDTDSVLPTFHNPENEEARVMSSYKPGLGKRAADWVKQWLAHRGFQLPLHHRLFRRKHNPKTI